MRTFVIIEIDIRLRQLTETFCFSNIVINISKKVILSS